MEVLSEDVIETNCSVIRAKNQLVFIGPCIFSFCSSFLLIQGIALQRERKETYGEPTDLCLVFRLCTRITVLHGFITY